MSDLSARNGNAISCNSLMIPNACKPCRDVMGQRMLCNRASVAEAQFTVPVPPGISDNASQGLQESGVPSSSLRVLTEARISRNFHQIRGI